MCLAYFKLFLKKPPRIQVLATMSAGFPKMLNTWCFHPALGVLSVHTEQMCSAIPSADQLQPCGQALNPVNVLLPSWAGWPGLSASLTLAMRIPAGAEVPQPLGAACKRLLELHCMSLNHTSMVTLTGFAALHVGLPAFKLFQYSQILHFKRCSIIHLSCLKQVCWNAWPNTFLNTVSQLCSCPN